MSNQDKVSRDVSRILKKDFWLPGLVVGECYRRLHDDNDGEKEGYVIVGFLPDGDAWITTDKTRGSGLRFRTSFGGGRSLRVRNALLILAEAIRLDNEDHPQE